MSREALQSKLKELEEEKAREKSLIKTNKKPSNTGKYREVKKVIARIKTLLKITKREQKPNKKQQKK
jgi:ribosomal protein L29